MSEAALDRVVTPKWLDLAFKIATENLPLEEAKTLLEVSLRDDIPSRVARRKTRSVLAHIWIDPPEEARPAISWATGNLKGDSLPWHVGAMLATYPFFGFVCRIVGQDLDMRGEVSTVEVRAKIRSKLGDRSTVDVGARRTVKTLRELGLLEGPPRSSISKRGRTIDIAGDDPVYSWLVNSLFLTRDIREMDIRDVRRSPELFMFDLPAVMPKRYPLLEKFTEGGGRVVLQVRAEEKPTAPNRKAGRQLPLPSMP